MLGKAAGLIFRRSTIVTLTCLSFACGVVAARVVSVQQWYEALWVFPLLLLRDRHRFIALVGLLVGLLLLGCWRGTVYMHQLSTYQTLQGQKVTLEATAIGDSVYGKQSQLSFEVGHVRTLHGPLLIGTTQVSGFGEPMIYGGDTVRLEGKIFMARGNDVARMSFAKIKVISHKGSPIDTFRRRFAAGLQSAVPEPHASFAMGLLVGQRNTLPSNVALQLQMVGLTHIIAVSGYNLTIIVRVAKRLFEKRSKYQYLMVSVALILCFLALAGLSPSIVRAAVVCGLSLATWWYGREMSAVALLSLSAAITIAANPLYAWNNVSWTLSFLAFFGVLVVSPIVTKRLYGSREPPLVMAIILESLSAEVMTIPYILLIFGQVSLVSTVANVLVAAWIPLAMLLSALAGLAGMFVPAIAGWLAWPATMLLTYMLDITTVLSKIPHAFVEHLAFSLWMLLLSYMTLTAVCMVAWHKRHQNDTITDRT